MCRRTDYQFPCSHIESRVELCSYRCYLARHSDPRNHHSCEVEMEPFEKHHVDVSLSSVYFKRSVAWVGAGLGVRRKQTVVQRLRIRYEEECDECCL